MATGSHSLRADFGSTGGVSAVSEASYGLGSTVIFNTSSSFGERHMELAPVDASEEHAWNEKWLNCVPQIFQDIALEKMVVSELLAHMQFQEPQHLRFVLCRSKFIKVFVRGIVNQPEFLWVGCRCKHLFGFLRGCV